jgi:uncharacterized membrane protein
MGQQNLGLPGDHRPQMTRVRSFMYRNFQTLQRSAMQSLVNSLVLEIFFITVLFALLVSIRLEPVITPYSKNEQNWASLQLAIIIMMFTGFTIFRVLTINLSASQARFHLLLIYLIVYQLIINSIYLVVEYNGIMTDKAIRIGIIVQGVYDDFEPESMFIHYARVMISIFGLITCLSLFVFIVSISIFLMSVNILQMDGNLGNANSMNR